MITNQKADLEYEARLITTTSTHSITPNTIRKPRSGSIGPILFTN
jgi:hypothetical protein